MELQVITQEGSLLVDSREVANMTGKRHTDLLRTIDGYVQILLDAKMRLVEFFRESIYKDSTGRNLKHYLLTRKGCDMVANKMTGEKGVLFTAAYVTKFEEMEKQQPRQLTEREQLKASMRLSLETSEELDKLKGDVTEIKSIVKERMTIDYAQAQAIRNAKNGRVEKLWCEGTVNKEVHDTKAKLHAAAWRDIKNAFGANSYHNIRSKDYDEALAYTKAWRPKIV